MSCEAVSEIRAYWRHLIAGYTTETGGSVSGSSLSSDDLWVAQMQSESELLPCTLFVSLFLEVLLVSFGV